MPLQTIKVDHVIYVQPIFFKDGFTNNVIKIILWRWKEEQLKIGVFWSMHPS